MLLYAVGKREERNVHIAENFADKISFYINPEIYKMEKEFKEGGNKFEKVNIEFAAQSAYGRATGIARSSPEMERALKAAHKKSEEMKSGKVPGTLYLTNKDASDEEALG